MLQGPSPAARQTDALPYASRRRTWQFRLARPDAHILHLGESALSRSPAIMARTIFCPVSPTMSEIIASWTFICARAFCMCWTCRAWWESSMSRCRDTARRAQISSFGRKAPEQPVAHQLLQPLAVEQCRICGPRHSSRRALTRIDRETPRFQEFEERYPIDAGRSTVALVSILQATSQSASCSRSSVKPLNFPAPTFVVLVRRHRHIVTPPNRYQSRRIWMGQFQTARLVYRHGFHDRHRKCRAGFGYVVVTSTFNRDDRFHGPPTFHRRDPGTTLTLGAGSAQWQIGLAGAAFHLPQQHALYVLSLKTPCGRKAGITSLTAGYRHHATEAVPVGL